MKFHRAHLLILCLTVLPRADAAEAAQRMNFRNNLLPGHLTQHKLLRTTRRTIEKPEHVETLIWQQQGKLTQCNISEPKPGSVMMYQMIADQQAKVLKLFRGDQLISPTPAAALFNLPQPSTRLHSVTMTARDAPAHVPLADRVNRTILHMLMDFAHWPQKQIPVGHRWERRLKLDDFEGTQRMEFVELTKIDGDMTARIAMSIEGKFGGKLEREYTFKKAEAILMWSRPDRVLTGMEAQVAYERQREGKPEEYDMRLSVTLSDARLLNDDAQEQVKVQLTAFSEALKAQREGHAVDVLRRCRDFRDSWPRSLWLPAVAQLEAQAAPQRAGTLSTREVRNLLVQNIVTWEAARSTNETDLVEKTEKVFARLADEHRAKLASLARDKEESVRAGAIFALAFSTDPGDAQTVGRALRDKSSQVRSMALAGLAARRDENVSVEALLKLMGDSEAVVRRRACQAAAACIPPEHYSIVAVVEKTAHLMIHDETDMVRREAVRTMAAIGAPADVESLKQALRHELNHGIRQEIEKAISTIEARS